HAAHTLHRDLKPSNVLVAADGRLVLLDFGLSIEWRGRAEAGLPIVGTRRYMAPEQMLSGTVTPASDCYAMGVLLYELLTGRAPYAGDFAEMARAKLRGDAPPLRSVVGGVPAELDELASALLLPPPAGGSDTRAPRRIVPPRTTSSSAAPESSPPCATRSRARGPPRSAPSRCAGRRASANPRWCATSSPAFPPARPPCCRAGA